MHNTMKIGWSISCIRKSRALLVVFVHLVLLIYGLLLTIQDMIDQQYPTSIYEVTYVVSYYLAHFTLILLLFVGIKKMWPLLYTPWLIVFFTVIVTATFLWIKSLIKSRIPYVVPSITNVLVLGLGWLGWFTVLNDFRLLLFKSRMRYRIWA